MKENRQYIDNGIFIIIYMYMHSFLVPFMFVINGPKFVIIELLANIVLFSCVAIINKIKFSKKFIIVYILLIIMMCINVFFSNYKEYVAPLAIRILIYLSVPLYIFTISSVDYHSVLNYWYKVARVMTYTLPLYYILRKHSIISYFEIATITHLNAMILMYYIIIKNNKKMYLLLINIILLGIFGSRMILVTTLVILLYILYLRYRNRFFYQKIIFTILLGSTTFYIYKHSLKILEGLSNFLTSKQLQSRNINSFISILSGTSIEEVSSGRDYIYTKALANIKENLIAPQGLGIMRIITDSTFFHAHNAALEIFLTFGFFIGLFFILGFIFFFIFKFKNLSYKSSEFVFLSLIFISYTLRSITGTYLFTDSFFLILFSIIISEMRGTNYEDITNILYR